MDPLWVGIIANAVALVATFIGRSIQLGRIIQKVDETAVNGAANFGKIELLRSEFNDHRVEVASKYATNADVERAIDRLDASLRQFLTALTQK